MIELNWNRSDYEFNPKKIYIANEKDNAPIDHNNIVNSLIIGENLEIMNCLDEQNIEINANLAYIDAPYNTGKEKFIGKDSAKENDIHSAWIEMMYQRLKKLKQFMSPEGFILMSIDDHELINARYLLNKIFGEEQFVCNFIWRRNDDINTDGVSVQHEYFLLYRVSNIQKELDLGGVPTIILPNTARKNSSNNYIFSPHQLDGRKNVNDLLGEGTVNNYPKPVELLEQFFELLLPSNNGVVIDIFAGSGTTAQAVIELNDKNNTQHKFIMMQLDKLKVGKKYSSVAELTKNRTLASIRNSKNSVNFSVFSSKNRD